MPCTRPLKGYRSGLVNPKTGKRSIVFSSREGFYDDSRFLIVLGCGQCMSCRLERSRQWAIRMMCEASLYPGFNCFITLTYSDDFLPLSFKPGAGVLPTLDFSHFQLFMKRLRKRFGSGIRFFHCGEYGCDDPKCGRPGCQHNARPHYHACLFNFDFPDKVLGRKTKAGFQCYNSQALDELWGMGRTEIGEVSFESAAYVARYVTKKVTGERSEVHYAGRKPEYTTMSRRPGIGKAWLDKYYADVYPRGFIVSEGRKQRPPNFFEAQFKAVSPEQAKALKRRRSKEIAKRLDSITDAEIRWQTIEEVVRLRLQQQLTRDL